MSKVRAALAIGLVSGCAASEPAPGPLLRVDQAKVAARLALFERLTSEEEVLDDDPVEAPRAEATRSAGPPKASFGGERSANEGDTSDHAPFGAGGDEGGARLRSSR